MYTDKAFITKHDQTTPSVQIFRGQFPLPLPGQFPPEQYKTQKIPPWTTTHDNSFRGGVRVKQRGDLSEGIVLMRNCPKTCQTAFMTSSLTYSTRVLTHPHLSNSLTFPRLFRTYTQTESIARSHWGQSGPKLLLISTLNRSPTFTEKM